MYRRSFYMPIDGYLCFTTVKTTDSGLFIFTYHMPDGDRTFITNGYYCTPA